MGRRWRHLRTDPACSRFLGWRLYGLIPRWFERHLRGIACPVCWTRRRPAQVPANPWPPVKL